MVTLKTTAWEAIKVASESCALVPSLTSVD